VSNHNTWIDQVENPTQNERTLNMKYSVLFSAFALIVACSPLPLSTLHVISTPESNNGRALPLNVIPVDQALAIQISAMSPEDWFTSDLKNTTSSITKRVLTGAQTEVVTIRRANNKNDFLVIVDFYESDKVDSQRILIGEAYHRAKNIYLLASKDKIQLIDKATFETFQRNQ